MALLSRLALVALALAAALATASATFEQTACGCLANPVGSVLTDPELARIRRELVAAGVDPATLTDNVLRALLQFMLQADFPGVVPRDRDGILQIFLEFLRRVPADFILGSEAVSGLQQQLAPGLSVPSGVQLQLIDVIPASSLVLGLRNVPVTSGQLQLVIQNAVASFLTAPGLEVSRQPLGQLVAYLDSLDRRLAQIVQLEELNAVRQALETRYNLDGNLFDQRFQRALDRFERTHADIVNSLNGLVFRGADFEVQVQRAIASLSQLFPGIPQETARIVIDVLQATNSQGGRGSPADILAIITTPEIASPLRQLSVVEIRQIQRQLPTQLTAAQVAEAYSLFLIGLNSQGITPVGSPRSEVLRVFIEQLRNYFLIEGFVYNSRNFLLFITRIVVPQIPRGSEAFQIRIFEPQIAVNDVVLVAEPLRDMFVEQRKTIIPDVFGIQGNSVNIIRRITSGISGPAQVQNVVNLRPRITTGSVPTYADFTYQSVTIAGRDFQRVTVVISRRYPALTLRRDQEPVVGAVLSILNSAGSPLPSQSAPLTDFLVSYIGGLPSVPLADQDALRPFLPGLKDVGLDVSDRDLNVAFQQFVIVTQVLGYQIPVDAYPQAFRIALLRYLNSSPVKELGLPYVSYLVQNLGKILGEIEIINAVVLTDSQLRQIFSSIAGNQMPSLDAQRAIVRLILARVPDDVLGTLVSPETVVAYVQAQLRQVIAANPGDLYFLQPEQIERLVNSVSGISQQQAIDANLLAYFGLGVNNILPPGDKFELILRDNINRYLRIYRPNTLGTSRFIQSIIDFQQAGRRIPEVPIVPSSISLVNQQPVPVVVQPPPVVSIADGIDIPEPQYNQFVNSLSARFPFLNSDSAQPTLGHIVGVLRTSGQGVVSANISGSVTNFISQLPQDLRLDVPDAELSQIIRDVDTDPEVRITGNGIRSGIAGVAISHVSLPEPLPLPSDQQRPSYLSFVLSQYRSSVRRQQLRFGEPFAGYLFNQLPQLPVAAQPYGLFDLPALYNAYQPYLSQGTPVSDVPLFTQVFNQAAPNQQLPNLLQLVNGLDAQQVNGGVFGPISDSELTALHQFGQSINLPSSITAPLLRRAFDPCRLALRLRLPTQLRNRSEVISFLQTLLRQTASRLTPQTLLSPQFINALFQNIDARLRASNPIVIKFGYKG